VPGVDGEKMSKSYDNTIEIFEPPASVRRKIQRIKTDSRPMEESKAPESDHLYQLYSLFVGERERQEMAATYRRGGFGYGEVKQKLAAAAAEYFAEARARREHLASHPETVRRVLEEGAQRARRKAGEVLRRAQRACGVKL
jgi:tryptophanyl-tRNA synthetase